MQTNPDAVAALSGKVPTSAAVLVQGCTVVPAHTVTNDAPTRERLRALIQNEQGTVCEILVPPEYAVRLRLQDSADKERTQLVPIQVCRCLVEDHDAGHTGGQEREDKQGQSVLSEHAGVLRWRHRLGAWNTGVGRLAEDGSPIFRVQRYLVSPRSESTAGTTARASGE